MFEPKSICIIGFYLTQLNWDIDEISYSVTINAETWIDTCVGLTAAGQPLP